DRQQGQFILKGDGAQAWDEPVEAAALLGKVVAVERNGSYQQLTNRFSGLFHILRAYVACVRRQAADFIPQLFALMLLAFLMTLLSPLPANAQLGTLCASSGSDGPGGTLGGIVNTYYPGNTT